MGLEGGSELVGNPGEVDLDEDGGCGGRSFRGAEPRGPRGRDLGLGGRGRSSRSGDLVDLGRAEGLELGEDLGEEGRLGVDAEHAPGEGVDDGQAAVPEVLLALLHEEGLQRVGDLVAHVRVGEVEAGEHHRLELGARADSLAVDQLPDEHVDEHHVRRVYECHLLKHTEKHVSSHFPTT